MTAPRELAAVRLLLAVGLLPLAVGLTPATAEVFELPVELELVEGPVALELHDAVLDIVLRPGEVSVLWARPLTADKPVVADLEVLDDGGELLVRRPPVAEGPVQRLQVELVIDPRWPLQVTGTELDIAVDAGADSGDDEDEEDDEVEEEDEEDDEDEENDEDFDNEEDEVPDREREGRVPATMQDLVPILAVEKSSLNLVGLRGARVEAVDSFVRVERGTGTLRLQLTGGTTEVDDYQGILELSARDSEIWLDETRGNVNLSVQGGSLVLRRGIGRCDGEVDDAQVQLETWRGPVDLQARGSTIEARSTVASPFKLGGEDLVVTLQDTRGSLEFNLRGGTVSSNGTQGQLRLEVSEDAEVAFDALRGSVVANLRAGAVGRFVGVNGLVRAEVHGSRFEVQGAQRLQLQASQADLTLSDLQQIAFSELTDTRLDLDLTTIRHPNPTLILEGRSEARVRLKSPCSVEIEGAEGSFVDADVSGCLVHTERRARQGTNSRGLDGNFRVVLKAKISDESTLEVEGVP
ncbi:MAG: hypothetical protein AAF657_03940 [Acidobacteriota bacterium]